MRLTFEAMSPIEIERVHQATMDLLESQGVAVKSKAALETFRRHGIKTEGERVHPGFKDLEAALASCPPTATINARDPEKSLTIGKGRPPALLSCSGVPMILTEDVVQRPVTFEDYRDMVKLTHTSPVLNMANSGALYPTWPRPAEALYLQMWTTLTMTDLPLVGQSEGTAVSKAAVELARAATGLSDQPVIAAICNSLSPLAWDERMLEGVEVFAKENQPINVSCCALGGATAPVQLHGTIVEANAEVLTGLLYAQLVGPGTAVIYGTTSSVMDMGAMGLALGAPEYSLVSAACAQMAARYKVPFRGGGGLTDAKVLDGQAGAESAWNLLLTLGEGADFILQAVGVLESFMCASFDKWLADEEILLKWARVARGLGPWPEDLAETMAQGREAGGFLKLKSTLKKFRSEYYRPTLADRRPFEAWKAAGRDYRAEAFARVAKRLEAYEEPTVEPESLAAMRAVMYRHGIDPDAKA